MRLLTVSHFYAAHGGGIECVASHLDRELAELGHITSWAAADEGAGSEGRCVHAVKLRCVDWLERLTGLPMPIPLPGSIRRLWRAVADHDGIIVHDALYASSILAVLAARHHRRPVILVQHIAGIPFTSPLLRAIMALATRVVTRPMLRAADQAVFISATVRDSFAGLRFRARPRLLFNGVDAALFRPPRAGERAAATAGRTILFVGRFVEKKGLTVLAELARLRPDCGIVLVGRGPIDPGRWRLANVTVLPHQSPAALSDLYRSADLLLLPSVGEGYPLVVQEAMASGLPVICGADTAQADPAAAEWLTGIHIDLMDPMETARRASAAIDGAAMPAGERAAMASYAAATYSWRGMAESIAALVEAAPPR